MQIPDISNSSLFFYPADLDRDNNLIAELWIPSAPSVLHTRKASKVILLSLRLGSKFNLSRCESASVSVQHFKLIRLRGERRLDRWRKQINREIIKRVVEFPVRLTKEIFLLKRWNSSADVEDTFRLFRRLLRVANKRRWSLIEIASRLTVLLAFRNRKTPRKKEPRRINKIRSEQFVSISNQINNEMAGLEGKSSQVAGVEGMANDEFQLVAPRLSLIEPSEEGERYIGINDLIIIKR